MLKVMSMKFYKGFQVNFIFIFEYAVPERLEAVINILGMLNKKYSGLLCNYSVEEEMCFVLDKWLSVQEMIGEIESDAFISSNAGDIYIKRGM